VVNPIAEKSKVPHFAVCTDMNVAKGRYNFVLYYSSLDYGHSWAQEFAANGYKNVALIILNHQGCLAVANAFKQVASQYGITITDEQTITPGERDFRSYLNKANTSNPDAFFLCVISPELEIIWEQYKQTGIKKFVTGPLSVAHDTKLTENIWFVETRQPSEEFQNKFKKRANTQMLTGVPNYYDIIRWTIALYEQAPSDKKPSSDWFVDELNRKLLR
jgi:ABC-type branched-subunit amino acid transport system substrate-binding protein